MPNSWELTQYSRGYNFIIGCDEAGRGALSGPVVAAAVILNPKHIKRISNAPSWYREIADSKVLRPQKREELSAFIKEYSLAWAIGEVAPGTRYRARTLSHRCGSHKQVRRGRGARDRALKFAPRKKRAGF